MQSTVTKVRTPFADDRAGRRDVFLARRNNRTCNRKTFSDLANGNGGEEKPNPQ